MAYARYYSPAQNYEYDYQKDGEGGLLKWGLIAAGGSVLSYVLFPELFDAWLFGGNEIAEGITVHGFATKGQQENISDSIQFFNSENPDYCQDFGFGERELDVSTYTLGYIPDYGVNPHAVGYVHPNIPDEVNVANWGFIGAIPEGLQRYVMTHELLHLCQSNDQIGIADGEMYVAGKEVDSVQGGTLIFEDGTYNSVFTEMAAEFMNIGFYFDIEAEDGDITSRIDLSSYGDEIEDFYLDLHNYLGNNYGIDLDLVEPEDVAEIMFRATSMGGNGYDNLSSLLVNELVGPYSSITIAEQDFVQMDSLLSNFVDEHMYFNYE